MPFDVSVRSTDSSTLVKARDSDRTGTQIGQGLGSSDRTAWIRRGLGSERSLRAVAARLRNRDSHSLGRTEWQNVGTPGHVGC
eukprot:764714-Hanusia_phi.AAC.1